MNRTKSIEATRGIHHVTAIASDAQQNLDFYSGVLGLRLVKQTVNFDDPETYHLYYGDAEGRPGTIMTFFPWKGAPRGNLGAGQTSSTAFSVPQGSLGFWYERLLANGLPVEDPRDRFSEEVLAFADPDGLRLELVAHEGASDVAPWQDGPLPEDKAIRSFHGVTLIERSLEATASVLTDGFGYIEGGSSGARHRFQTPAGGVGSVVDVVVRPEEGSGRIAVGSVHHVAFRVVSDEEHARWRERLLSQGRHVTTVRDRKYFHSIYFREPGGVLFEVATDPPGFSVDESVGELGSRLQLPEWLEPQRDELDKTLQPLTIPSVGAAAL
jgi:glyoxalase family protein